MKLALCELFLNLVERDKRYCLLAIDGGREGIRTLDKAFDPIHAFQACAFNRSATLPFNIF